MGFPIRKSADQSSFAAPHGLSQRTTSFIACACQGIHRTPFRHLIALIINARAARKGGRSRKSEVGNQKPESSRSPLAIPTGRHCILGPAPRQEAPDPFRPTVEPTMDLERPVYHTRLARRPRRSSSRPDQPAPTRGASGQLFSSRCQCRPEGPAEIRKQKSEVGKHPTSNPEFWLLISGF
jgi:hypothetical protein